MVTFLAISRSLLIRSTSKSSAVSPMCFVFISIVVNDEAESVANIFDSAVADEKEIYDLFGVKFLGNDELRRLYMPESWKGHPLKKDYEDKDERLNWND